MKPLCLLLLLVSLSGYGAMDISRELVAPERLVPGQPVRVAVTFWTDSWFNPPPEWPDQVVRNGALLTTPLPNQLLTRQQDGKSWSGVRMERLVSAWDPGTLSLPALEVTLSSAGQAPHTVSLPAVERPVAWPPDVKQPDRFLPASALTLSQKLVLYRSGEGDELHVGDAIERQVTVKAEGVVPSQIPQLLYAIPGQDSQRLPPVNSLLDSGRGDFGGGQREERLRYLPTRQGKLVLPPLTLRWWDTSAQRWQSAELPGADYEIQGPRAAGREAELRAGTASHLWRYLSMLGGLAILAVAGFFARHSLLRGWQFARLAVARFWRPVPLPNLTPSHKEN
ncbi:oxygen tolerance domain protein [Aeromonas taiwanensis]|uniref:oxygen tolerance domain protein n=1 Tax=Aeromonas taiwanensis TaxID=633417 RepID=UPI00398A1D82